MSIIGDAFTEVQKEFPNKSPKTLRRKIRRTVKKQKKSRKDRKYILSFAIAIFDALLPEAMIDEITKTCEPKIRKRLLTVRVLLLGLIVHNLSPEIKSYNDLIRELSMRLAHRLPHGVTTILSKSSFTYQLTTRSPKIFKALLIFLLETLMRHMDNQALIKGTYSLKAIDCSTFNLVPSLASFFGTSENQSGSGKCQSKVNTVFDVTRKLVKAINIGTATENEKLSLKKLFDATNDHNPNTIWLCDLGYWAFWFMDMIIEKNQHFVFRLRENTTYTVVKTLDENNQDYLVKLGCPTSRDPYPMQNVVRLIACPQEGSEIYWYITSLLNPEEFNAQEIRSLYKNRWQIEIFFRDLKHVMEFQPMAKSKNGVEIEFYGALITYTLVRVIMIDAAVQHDMACDDLSFSESYQTVNTYLRKHYRLFSESPIEDVIQKYSSLLELIALTCINESAKKRSAKKRRIETELQCLKIAI